MLNLMSSCHFVTFILYHKTLPQCNKTAMLLPQINRLCDKKRLAENPSLSAKYGVCEWRYTAPLAGIVWQIFSSLA